MQCVILAGGLGTRMQAYTEQIPKALIPVNGTPFIHYQLTHLARTGVTDVVLCIGYRGEQIREYVQKGKAWNLSVCYVDEGSDLQGTAGALRLALQQKVLDDGFLVTYGDSFIPIDFSRIWRYFQNGNEPILMTVFRNADHWDKSNVIYEGNKVVLYDKSKGKTPNPRMQYIDYGLLAMKRSVIETLPPGPLDLAVLLKEQSQRGAVAGLEINERFYEAGSPGGLKDLSDYLKSGYRRS